MAVQATRPVQRWTWQLAAAEAQWNPANIKPCDRACLIGIMGGYMSGIFQHNPKLVPPLAIDVRMTENTAHMGTW